MTWLCAIPETSNEPRHCCYEGKQDVQEEEDGEVKMVAVGGAGSGYDVVTSRRGFKAGAVVEDCLVGYRYR